MKQRKIFQLGNSCKTIKNIIFREILEEYREKCEYEGNYIEAEGAAKRIDELKNEDKLRKKDHLTNSHLQEVCIIYICYTYSKYFRKLS